MRVGEHQHTKTSAFRERLTWKKAVTMATTMEMAVLESSDSKKVMVEPDNEKDFKKLVDNSKPGYSTNVVAKEDT